MLKYKGEFFGNSFSLKGGIGLLFGKHINRYYIRYLPAFLGGIIALLLVDYMQLVVPELYRTVINGMTYGTAELDGVTVPFDMPFLLDHVCLPLIAKLEGDSLEMQVYTDQKGVQLYTANFLKGEPDFSGGIKRISHGAVCLETQTEPGAISRGEIFYEKGQTYKHRTVYSVKKRS